jgi:hypothetical protein
VPGSGFTDRDCCDCHTTVYLGKHARPDYASVHGHALIDRELYLPRSCTEDRDLSLGPRPGRSGGIISANGRLHLRSQVLKQRGRCGLERLYRVVEPGGRESFLAGRRGEHAQRLGHLTVQVLGLLEEVP